MDNDNSAVTITGAHFLKKILSGMPSKNKKNAQKVTLEHSHLTPPSPKLEWDKRNWDIKNSSLTPSLPSAIGTNKNGVLWSPARMRIEMRLRCYLVIGNVQLVIGNWSMAEGRRQQRKDKL